MASSTTSKLNSEPKPHQNTPGADEVCFSTADSQSMGKPYNAGVWKTIDRYLVMFQQQKLPAWKPTMTANSVFLFFFMTGFACVILGVAVLLSTNSVFNRKIDYTTCEPPAGDDTFEDFKDCSVFTANITNVETVGKTACPCVLEFNITDEAIALDKDIYVYYHLDNYFQNHRRYVNSRDYYQLRGDDISDPKKTLDDNCDPYRVDGDRAIAPCGAIANSMFNDTFSIYYVPEGADEVEIGIKRTGIAWSTDIEIKFSNPPPADDLKKAFEKYTKPPNWNVNVYELSDSDDNNGYENEALIVWMRTAALPYFSKPYGILNRTGLKAGKYQVHVSYRYPVVQFDGTKAFVIASSSWIGGKNEVIIYGYLVTGAVCIVSGLVILVIHLCFTKTWTKDLRDV